MENYQENLNAFLDRPKNYFLQQKTTDRAFYARNSIDWQDNTMLQLLHLSEEDSESLVNSYILSKYSRWHSVFKTKNNIKKITFHCLNFWYIAAIMVLYRTKDPANYFIWNALAFKCIIFLWRKNYKKSTVPTNY